MSRSSPGSSSPSHSPTPSSDGPGGLVVRQLRHVPGLQDDDPPVLLAPRPRSWSVARRDASGESSPEVVERLLGALLGDQTVPVALHVDESDEASLVSSSRGSSASPNNQAAFTPTDPPSSSPPSDPRSSAYTLARSHQPSSPSISTSSASSSPRPDRVHGAPSPHSAAAQEVLRTLAAMASSSRPPSDERAPFAPADMHEFELADGHRRPFDSAGLSAVEERTEECTVASGSARSALGQRLYLVSFSFRAVSS